MISSSRPDFQVRSCRFRCFTPYCAHRIIKRSLSPNAELSNASAINYSAYETRRANVKLLVSYEQNLPHVKEVIHSVIEQQPLILKDPAPAVVMGGFGGEDGAIIYARVWAERSNYWTMYFAFWKLSKRHLKNRGSKSLTASLPCISSKARRAAMHWDKPLRTLCGRVFTAACLLLFAVSPLWAAAFLTEEEITYIAGRKTVQAINVEGGPRLFNIGMGGGAGFGGVYRSRFCEKSAR